MLMIKFPKFLVVILYLASDLQAAGTEEQKKIDNAVDILRNLSKSHEKIFHNIDQLHLDQNKKPSPQPDRNPNTRRNSSQQAPIRNPNPQVRIPPRRNSNPNPQPQILNRPTDQRKNSIPQPPNPNRTPNPQPRIPNRVPSPQPQTPNGNPNLPQNPNPNPNPLQNPNLNPNTPQNPNPDPNPPQKPNQIPNPPPQNPNPIPNPNLPQNPNPNPNTNPPQNPSQIPSPPPQNPSQIPSPPPQNPNPIPNPPQQNLKPNQNPIPSPSPQNLKPNQNPIPNPPPQNLNQILNRPQNLKPNPNPIPSPPPQNLKPNQNPIPSPSLQNLNQILNRPQNVNQRPIAQPVNPVINLQSANIASPLSSTVDNALPSPIEIPSTSVVDIPTPPPNNIIPPIQNPNQRPIAQPVNPAINLQSSKNANSASPLSSTVDNSLPTPIEIAPPPVVNIPPPPPNLLLANNIPPPPPIPNAHGPNPVAKIVPNPPQPPPLPPNGVSGGIKKPVQPAPVNPAKQSEPDSDASDVSESENLTAKPKPLNPFNDFFSALQPGFSSESQEQPVENPALALEPDHVTIPEGNFIHKASDAIEEVTDSEKSQDMSKIEKDQSHKLPLQVEEIAEPLVLKEASPQPETPIDDGNSLPVIEEETQHFTLSFETPKASPDVEEKPLPSLEEKSEISDKSKEPTAKVPADELVATKPIETEESLNSTSETNAGHKEGTEPKESHPPKDITSGLGTTASDSSSPHKTSVPESLEPAPEKATGSIEEVHTDIANPVSTPAKLEIEEASHSRISSEATRAATSDEPETEVVPSSSNHAKEAEFDDATKSADSGEASSTPTTEADKIPEDSPSSTPRKHPEDSKTAVESAAATIVSVDDATNPAESREATPTTEAGNVLEESSSSTPHKKIEDLKTSVEAAAETTTKPAPLNKSSRETSKASDNEKSDDLRPKSSSVSRESSAPATPKPADDATKPADSREATPTAEAGRVPDKSFSSTPLKHTEDLKTSVEASAEATTKPAASDKSSRETSKASDNEKSVDLGPKSSSVSRESSAPVTPEPADDATISAVSPVSIDSATKAADQIGDTASADTASPSPTSVTAETEKAAEPIVDASHASDKIEATTHPETTFAEVIDETTTATGGSSSRKSSEDRVASTHSGVDEPSIKATTLAESADTEISPTGESSPRESSERPIASTVANTDVKDKSEEEEPKFEELGVTTPIHPEEHEDGEHEGTTSAEPVHKPEGIDITTDSALSSPSNPVKLEVEHLKENPQKNIQNSTPNANDNDEEGPETSEAAAQEKSPTKPEAEAKSITKEVPPESIKSGTPDLIEGTDILPLETEGLPSNLSPKLSSPEKLGENLSDSASKDHSIGETPVDETETSISETASNQEFEREKEENSNHLVPPPSDLPPPLPEGIVAPNLEIPPPPDYLLPPLPPPTVEPPKDSIEHSLEASPPEFSPIVPETVLQPKLSVEDVKTLDE